jgi:AcrR family transcriptional regulator
MHLVRSAAELFDRNGFAGATLDEVTRTAGVTKGAFYFHFASKRELGGAVQAQACAMLRIFVGRLLVTETHALQSLIDITHKLAMWLDTEPVIRASLRTARECGDRGRPFVDFYVELLTTIDTTLRRAAGAGELQDGVVVDVVSTLVVTFCVGIDVLRWSGTLRGSARAGLSELWGVILPGIVSPARAAQLRAGGSTAIAGD